MESVGGAFTHRECMFKATDSQMNLIWPFMSLLVPNYVTSYSRLGSGPDVEFLRDATGIPNAERIPDSQRYFDFHHAGNDVFEKVNKRELELGVINMADLIYVVEKNGL